MHLQIIRTLTAALVAAGTLACLAQAPAKLYVAPTGDDASAGSLSSPFKTISKAVSRLQPGQTLVLRGGTYAEQVVVSVDGTPAAPVTIQAYPGESVVIDGQGKLPLHRYEPLVWIKSSNVRLDGFEIRNSKQAGLYLDGEHDSAGHLDVNHALEAGVLARGDATIVEYSRIWENAYLNCRLKQCPPSPYLGGAWATGLSAARNPVGGITHGAILRHNTAYNNWGEGISSYEAEGTVMEDNVSYDNWATNYYISDSSNVLFQRNLCYISSSYTDGRAKLCIQLSDERSDKPRSHSNVIINNVCVNGSLDAFSWTDVKGSGLVDDLIANNTILHGWLKAGSKSIATVNSHTRIVNNLFDFDGSVTPYAGDGVEFSHNLWSTKPADAALGDGSIVAKPLLHAPEVVVPGKVAFSDFTPGPASPAAKAGQDLSKVVPTDALGRPRGNPPSIGALEVRP